MDLESFKSYCSEYPIFYVKTQHENWYQVLNTNFYIGFLAKIIWYQAGHENYNYSCDEIPNDDYIRNPSFEKIFETVSPAYQEHLLFHLNLFR